MPLRPLARRTPPPGWPRSDRRLAKRFEFTSAGGRLVQFTTDSVGRVLAAPVDVGDQVDILYNPANPQDAIVRGGERTAAYLFGTSGFVFTVIGLLMALSALDLYLR
jgi:hypothetical protein